MAQSAFRCSAVDFSGVMRGSLFFLLPTELGFGGALGRAAVVGAVGFESCSRRGAVVVWNGWQGLAIGRGGSHGVRVWGLVKLHREQASGERVISRGIMAIVDGSS